MAQEKSKTASELSAVLLAMTRSGLHTKLLSDEFTKIRLCVMKLEGIDIKELLDEESQYLIIQELQNKIDKQREESQRLAMEIVEKRLILNKTLQKIADAENVIPEEKDDVVEA
jgi:hypothetical protein